MTKEGQNQGSPKALIFGGTTEGRLLCEFCAKQRRPVLYCVASADGARPVEGLPGVEARAGRMNEDEMTAFLHQKRPALTLDATHPYAAEASRNIAAACLRAQIPLLRITRMDGDGAAYRKEQDRTAQDCIYFKNTDDLLAWLEEAPGQIFVATGASLAKVFAQLLDFQDRVWMRILPNMDSLHSCLKLGYRPDRLICMQGPFTEALNRALFALANATVLVTKDTGVAGGFPEKIRAARSLGMRVAILSKPRDENGVSLREAYARIMKLRP